MKRKVFLKRFIRTFLPQVPAIVTYLLSLLAGVNLPVYVIPTLTFLGAVATALDKLLRDAGYYD